MFAYGIRPASVIRGNILEALIVGVVATILGVAAGYAILRWIIDVSMRATMPDLGTLISISAGTYGLAALAGIVTVMTAPLLTLRRLRRTDVPSALRSLSSTVVGSPRPRLTSGLVRSECTARLPIVRG